ncbi:MAG TPA: glycosyltransferase [Gemmatimonadales bacterium]|nr:glycosyltransferase [Gemmatimonadales bacterium]
MSVAGTRSPGRAAGRGARSSMPYPAAPDADRPDDAAPGPVLVVAPQPVYEDRGTPIAVRQVIEALLQLGHRVELLTYPVGQPLGLEDHAGLEVVRIANPLRIRRVPIGLSWQKLVLDAVLGIALARRLAARRYRCIHAVEEAAFLAVLLGRRTGTPVIYDMQSSLPEQLGKHPLFRVRPLRALIQRSERWLLRRADVVVTSMGLAGRVRAQLPAARVHEWRFASEELPGSAADAEAVRAELAIPAGAPLALYCGTFEAYQGLPLLVEAIPLLRARHPEAVVVLVGADSPHEAVGPENPAVAALLAAGALRIVPRQPRERIGAYLHAADVLVSPRRFGNNLPLKIFDYLGTGRPIVATDIPTHRAVLTAERAMLVAPTAAALAGGIGALLDDPALARRLAAAAARYAEAHLGWSGFVDSVEGIYQEVARGARV